MSRQRDEAIAHVVDNTIYWFEDANKITKNGASLARTFRIAVQHVQCSHYALSAHDIEEAKKKLIERRPNLLIYEV